MHAKLLVYFISHPMLSRPADCFCAVPLLVGWLVGLGPKFLDNGFQSSLNGSTRNLHTSLVWDRALKLNSKICLPTPKKFAGNLKVAYSTFIHHTGILKRIKGSQFWF